jgi:hypothetical protein
VRAGRRTVAHKQNSHFALGHGAAAAEKRREREKKEKSEKGK